MKTILLGALSLIILMSVLQPTVLPILMNTPALQVSFRSAEAARMSVSIYGGKITDANTDAVGMILLNECSKHTVTELPKHKREIEAKITAVTGADVSISFDKINDGGF